MKYQERIRTRPTHHARHQTLKVDWKTVVSGWQYRNVAEQSTTAAWEVDVTYPPQEPGDRPGIGDPGSNVPEFHVPAAPASPPPPQPPPSAPPPPPPSKTPKGPWIAVAALAVVAVVGVVVSLMVFDSNSGQQPTAEDNGGGDGNSSGIACEPPDEEPQGEKLDAETFYDDKRWTGVDMMTDEEVAADRLGTWNHSDCCDIGLASAQEVLNEAGCAYAIESAYETDDAHMGISQLVLVFSGSESAMQAADLDFTSFRFQPDSGVYDDTREIYGYSEPSGQYLVLTIGAIDDSNSDIIESSTAALETFHIDFASELPW